MSFELPKSLPVTADSVLTNPSAPVLDRTSLTTVLPGQVRPSASLLFVDGSVADYGQLVAGAAPGTEVHVLTSAQDAVTQITNTLLGRSGISSLQIVSHGESGGLDFGSSRLNLTELPGYAAQVQSWGTALTDDADLLLYGCNVASGELGQTFVNILSQLTGADVAASEDVTGSAALGGNWVLEYQTGQIESEPGIASSNLRDYQAILPTTLVSSNSSGTQGNNISSNPSISADGRYVAFNSDASNLVSGDTNGTTDVFVRDLQTGSVTLVSSSSSGTQGNNISSFASISADGRYVAFDSAASNLVSGDTNGTFDVFVKDLQTGSVTLVSSSTNSTQGNNDSINPSISASGRYVAFESDASNLVGGDTNGKRDVFVRDLITQSLTLVSRRFNGTQSNGDSYNPSISTGLGDYMVAFESDASNLVSGDTNGKRDVFYTLDGNIYVVSSSISIPRSNGDSYNPSFSANGRYVAFESDASNLVSGDTNGERDVFYADLAMGSVTLVSSSNGTQGNGASYNPSISAGGEYLRKDVYVAFESDASNLVSGDTNGKRDVFVKNSQTGSVTLFARSSNSTQGNSDSYNPSISGDGLVVAFNSDASNLMSGDTNGTLDVFVVTNSTSNIFWRNGANGNLTLWQLNGTELLKDYVLPTINDLNWSVASLADFTGDGLVDILWRNGANGNTTLWELNGTSLKQDYVLPTINDLNWSVAGVADFTGDGKADLLWRNGANGNTTLWELNGTSLKQDYVLPTINDLNWSVAGVADFTGDGKADLLWRNRANGNTTLWELNGTSLKQDYVLPTINDLNWSIAGVADFTGDGKADLLWRNGANGNTTLWELNGTSLKQDYVLPTINDLNWKIVNVSDFTGDDKADLLWRNGANGNTTLWELDGTNLRQDYVLPTINDLNWEVQS
jgi:Tol biopolymer transport system component